MSLTQIFPILITPWPGSQLSSEVPYLDLSGRCGFVPNITWQGHWSSRPRLSGLSTPALPTSPMPEEQACLQCGTCPLGCSRSRPGSPPVKEGFWASPHPQPPGTCGPSLQFLLLLATALSPLPFLPLPAPFHECLGLSSLPAGSVTS